MAACSIVITTSLSQALPPSGLRSPDLIEQAVESGMLGDDSLELVARVDRLGEVGHRACNVGVGDDLSCVEPGDVILPV